MRARGGTFLRSVCACELGLISLLFISLYNLSLFVVLLRVIVIFMAIPQGTDSIQAYKMESVILQIMNTMVKGNARVVTRVNRAFSEREARAAYEYLVKTHAKHGWENPPAQDG